MDGYNIVMIDETKVEIDYNDNNGGKKGYQKLLKVNIMKFKRSSRRQKSNELY